MSKRNSKAVRESTKAVQCISKSAAHQSQHVLTLCDISVKNSAIKTNPSAV